MLREGPQIGRVKREERAPASFHSDIVGHGMRTAELGGPRLGRGARLQGLPFAIRALVLEASEMAAAAQPLAAWIAVDIPESGGSVMSVKHVDSVEHEPVAAGTATTRQVLIGADQGPHFAMRRFVIAPGGSMPAHTNSVEHEQYVLAGRARIGIGDQEHEVATGNVVFIPAGVPHWYRCLGDQPFAFLCVVPDEEDVITLVP
jgi:quercetin dioxygenase-like cupin family protein